MLVVWAAANMQLQKYLSPSKVQSSIFANGLPHVRESEFWNPGNFFLHSLESWSLESGIQLKKSGISLTTGLHNPGSTDEDWSPVPWIWNPQYGIHNPRLSWIALHEAKIVKDSHHDYWLNDWKKNYVVGLNINWKGNKALSFKQKIFYPASYVINF